MQEIRTILEKATPPECMTMNVGVYYYQMKKIHLEQKFNE